MDVLRAPLFHRRVTQIYSDTKRFYEQIVQQHVTNPQAAALHQQLRIQKDRFMAWGIEWEDSNAQQGDIDESLDRAGISDLVSSIISSIQELLKDAENVQPSFQPPGQLPDRKGGFLSMPNRQWTAEDLARLRDLNKSVTVSIDTLCDLSRSTLGMRQSLPPVDRKRKPGMSGSSSKAQSRSSTPVSYSPHPSGASRFGLTDFLKSTRVDMSRLRFPHQTRATDPTPPEYDAVTASADNRKFAFLDADKASEPQHAERQSLGLSLPEVPVLVDYGYSFDSGRVTADLTGLDRYESLILALQGIDNGDSEGLYTGCLRIIGWFQDSSGSSFGFVYEIPVPSPMSSNPASPSTPVTLLSFLQHSGSTDSENTPSLEDRFRLALNLVTNILHTHAKGITHRHINSNNVIFVDNSFQSDVSKPWKEGIIRKPYLVSWDQNDRDATSTPEMHVPRLYRHPESEIGKRSAYKPAYDVYSLGLVLLEIGLWMPIHKLFKSKYTLPKFRLKLRSTYAHKLAGKCGSAYMKVVEYCLRAADKETSPTSTHRLSRDFHQAKRQEDFYWKALKPLERCCLIDYSNEPVVHPFPSMAAAKFSTPDVAASHTVAQAAPTLQVPHERPEECLEADCITSHEGSCPVLVWSYEIPSHIRSYYKQVMMPKLNKMFARAINRWEAYTIMTFMAGETPQTAKPTIYMSCLSIVRATKILEYVNKDQQYFDIKVSVGQTVHSKANKKRGRKTKKKTAAAANLPQGNADETVSDEKYQAKPACGASISAFVDEQHLGRATFGGFILADGEPFGMSVHHMLEDQDVDQGLDFVLDNRDSDGNDSGGQPSDSASMPAYQATTHPLDDEFDPSILDHDFSDEDDELFTMGDTLGTPPGGGRDKVVTQPALDDVDSDFFPTEEDKSDEHLQSHSLGYIHASSGRKQVKHGNDSIAHEVDWALFKVCDHRLDARNKIEGGDKFYHKAPTLASFKPHPCQIVAADALGDRQVHAIGATSGLAGGTILPEMVDQKMPGRVFSSTVWRFKGEFGVGGDSGAWIVDNATGAVCGHVTAWNERCAYGILTPMEVMLHDMERTLGKAVALPTSSPTERDSYTDQIITPPSSQKQRVQPISVHETDEAIDLPSASTTPPLAPQIREDSTADHTLDIGQQFSSLSLQQESSVDDTTRPTTVDTDDEDTSDQSSKEDNTISLSTSPALPTSPPQPPRSLGEMKLDDVAERWAQSQMSGNSLSNSTSSHITTTNATNTGSIPMCRSGSGGSAASATAAATDRRRDRSRVSGMEGVARDCSLGRGLKAPC